MKKLFFLFSTLITSPAVFAHPGHGSHGDYTITHYFTEPVHAWPLLLAIVLAIVLIRREKRRAVK